MSEWRICGKRNFVLCFKSRRIGCFDNKFTARFGDTMNKCIFAKIFGQVGFGAHQRLCPGRDFKMFGPQSKTVSTVIQQLAAGSGKIILIEKIHFGLPMNCATNIFAGSS